MFGLALKWDFQQMGTTDKSATQSKSTDKNFLIRFLLIHNFFQYSKSADSCQDKLLSVAEMHKKIKYTCIFLAVIEKAIEKANFSKKRLDK